MLTTAPDNVLHCHVIALSHNSVTGGAQGWLIGDRERREANGFQSNFTGWCAIDVPYFPKDTTHSIFNFWAAILCVQPCMPNGVLHFNEYLF